jgi:hypothetical protein
LEYVATLEVSFKALLDSRGRAAGTEEFPAGRRMYIAYSGTLRTYEQTMGEENDKPLPFIIKGKLGDGRNSDWALVRNDGCLLLDARLLIEVEDPQKSKGAPNGHGELPTGGSSRDDSKDVPKIRFAVALTGIGKLSELYRSDEDGEVSGADAYKRWISGDPPKSDKMNVGLSVRFEVSGPPETGAAKRYREAAGGYEKYLGLAQGTFVASGTITVTTSKEQRDPEIGFLSGMTARILQLQPQPPEEVQPSKQPQPPKQPKPPEQPQQS